MKFILILLVTVIAVSYGLPLDSGKDAKILKYENILGENGMYRFSYETSDGTTREESGTVEKKGDEEIIIVQGSYSFFDDTGERHEINYIADDLGYRIKPMVVAFASPGVLQRIDPGALGSLVGGGVG